MIIILYEMIKMNTNNIVIRLEKKEEYREVENLVRESFWNVYRPGCFEHYVLNQLRYDPAFVAELDFVMPRFFLLRNISMTILPMQLKPRLMTGSAPSLTMPQTQ